MLNRVLNSIRVRDIKTFAKYWLNSIRIKFKGINPLVIKKPSRKYLSMSIFGNPIVYYCKSDKSILFTLALLLGLVTRTDSGYIWLVDSLSHTVIFDIFIRLGILGRLSLIPVISERGMRIKIYR